MHFSIDTFMTRGLQLSKTDLLVYALIHSFSQDKKGCYWGSISYTAQILNCSERAVIYSLRSLEKRNLIKKAGFNAEYGTSQYVAIVPKGLDAKIAEGCKNCTSTPAKIITKGMKNLHPIDNNIIKDNNNGVTSIFDR